ncbi:Clavaminate synthase-like protein [Pisolithus marmoratus]|nr:Clavaminate synthase-like protein [Pisolithus marmoratus]
MTIVLAPLPLPASADPSKFADFGREVKGVEPGNLSPEQFSGVYEALHKHSALLFRNVILTPEQQYALTKAFDPESESYGHGNNKTGSTKKSILHPDLKTIPRVPQVQLIGNGMVYNHEGLESAALKHPSHTTFHKTRVSEEDEQKGYTRFYRWHIDAALYDYNPPRVTTLYGIKVPTGPKQIVRYDDGTGDELPVPLGTTAFVSGKTMFDMLPPEYKRSRRAHQSKVCAPPLRMDGTGPCYANWLGYRNGSPRTPIERASSLWKNPVTGELHFQVHPCGVQELIIDPLPQGAKRDRALYPDGAHLKDLNEVRLLLYRMQRPAIAPQLVYPHDWQERDLVLFHNRGVLHTVVGAFKPDQVRAFHQCNLAASDVPQGPSESDVFKWA